MFQEHGMDQRLLCPARQHWSDALARMKHRENGKDENGQLTKGVDMYNLSIRTHSVVIGNLKTPRPSTFYIFYLPRDYVLKYSVLSYRFYNLGIKTFRALVPLVHPSNYHSTLPE